VIRSQSYRVIGVVLITTITAASVLACRIPVFRYALERWPPDSFELIVVHRGDLDEQQSEIVRSIESRTTDDTQPINLRVTTIDIDQDDLSPENRTLFDTLQTDVSEIAAPRMILLFPSQRRQATVAWQGELTADNVARLVDSPLRRKVVEQVLEGDSAVWVLIDGSNKDANDAAAATLELELGKVENLIKLPTQEILEAEEEFRADTAVELRLGFTLLRLRRDDPSEAVFLSMLLGTESDLRDFDEPIAIPIYGRGRTYYALVGKGINADLIEQNCRFICGDCSCQVKEQNPGSDVLLAVNWDEQIRGTAFSEQELPELTGIGGLEVIDLGQYERELEDNKGPTKDAMIAATAIDKASPSETEADRPDSEDTTSDDQGVTTSPSVTYSQTESATVSVSEEARTETQPVATSPLWWTLFPVVGVALIVAVAGMILMQMRS
jgi:hypothetical protein